eukprot:TRINITY_DN11733_c0_g1_i1.p1 TRINITY_DN11733_c0_g1~~TRINITY_DN11733_c0_g1_i1.p1  ORF type:complete len:113 (-),score=4.57 TRINITY_DN11733_c0_g1_i1:23-361(-)
MRHPFYHSMDPDLKLSRNNDSNKVAVNTLEHIHYDMEIIKEILVNWYSIIHSYDYGVHICNEMDVLTLMVIVMDCTFPIIQEQLINFKIRKTFKEKRKSNRTRRRTDYVLEN